MTSRSDSMRFFLYFLFFYIVPVLTTRSVGLSLRRYHLQVGIIMIIFFVRCLIEVFPSWLFRRFNSISSAAVLKVWSFSIRDFNFFSLYSLLLAEAVRAQSTTDERLNVRRRRRIEIGKKLYSAQQQQNERKYEETCCTFSCVVFPPFGAILLSTRLSHRRRLC